MTASRVDHDALLGPGVVVGRDSQIWGLTQIRENCAIGEHCVIGRGVYIGPGIHVGDNCKIQNYALLYEPAVIGAGVFIGPAVVLTNDRYPRATNPDGRPKNSDDWHPEGVFIGEGASIGARAVCVGPLSIGEWAMVGAGSVVTKDVAPFSMVMGSPAKHVYWVGRSGKRLNLGPNGFVCPDTGETFKEFDGLLRMVA